MKGENDWERERLVVRFEVRGVDAVGIGVVDADAESDADGG